VVSVQLQSLGSMALVGNTQQLAVDSKAEPAVGSRRRLEVGSMAWRLDGKSSLEPVCKPFSSLCKVRNVCGSIRMRQRIFQSGSL
jgi:hypothetical protein